MDEPLKQQVEAARAEAQGSQRQHVKTDIQDLRLFQRRLGEQSSALVRQVARMPELEKVARTYGFEIEAFRQPAVLDIEQGVFTREEGEASIVVPYEPTNIVLGDENTQKQDVGVVVMIFPGGGFRTEPPARPFLILCAKTKKLQQD